MEIFSVHDSKANAYLTPFFAPTEGVALRQLSSAIKDENHEFNRYAEDYTLFQVGHWDEDTGTITGTPPRSIVNCLSLKSMAAGNGNLTAITDGRNTS